MVEYKHGMMDFITTIIIVNCASSNSKFTFVAQFIYI